jgi:hypothetical protein
MFTMWLRPLPAHHRQRGAHDVYDPPEVRRELALDVRRGHLLEVAEEAVARVVDQDVDAAKPLHRLLNRHLGLRLVGDVQLDEREVLADLVSEGSAHLVEVAAGGDHAVAGLKGRLGGACANTAAGTSNKPDFTRHFSLRCIGHFSKTCHCQSLLESDLDRVRTFGRLHRRPRDRSAPDR